MRHAAVLQVTVAVWSARLVKRIVQTRPGTRSVEGSLTVVVTGVRSEAINDTKKSTVSHPAPVRHYLARGFGACPAG
ncbi:hypothetical protein [Streptomyces sp. NPDC057403]|uniref:hypothetical protein n=1 Tax=Streptomyces sp. NPDC057403 TaxID=3346119 RepID=UPI00369CE395